MQGKTPYVLSIRVPERELNANIREINKINKSLPEHNPRLVDK